MVINEGFSEGFLEIKYSTHAMLIHWCASQFGMKERKPDTVASGGHSCDHQVLNSV